MSRQLVDRAVAELVPYAGNARTHSEAQIDQIVASIREFGFTNPILVDGTGVIAGHGRLRAAVKLGMASVPCLELAGLSEAQKRAYVIADNKLALNAGWDLELLTLELSDLKALDFDLELTAFTERELNRLLGPAGGLTNEDETPPVPLDPVSAAGDLWILGRHRLLCGNSRSKQDIHRALVDERAALCLTDPPYGVGEAYSSFTDTQEGLVALIAEFLPLVRAISDRVLLTPGNSNQTLYPKPEWTLAWSVPAGVGRGPWGFSCWQPVLAYGKDPYLAEGLGCRPDGLVLQEAADNSLGHPCSKPVRVWSWLMERGSAHKGQVVLDVFCGSGTTIIAAEQLDRRCCAIEIDPAYVDVAVKRWQNFTGQKAFRESDGRAFDELREPETAAA